LSGPIVLTKYSQSTIKNTTIEKDKYSLLEYRNAKYLLSMPISTIKIIPIKISKKNYFLQFIKRKSDRQAHSVRLNDSINNKYFHIVKKKKIIEKKKKFHR